MVKLKVYRPEFDDLLEFDDPETIARASEGFCPFPRHFAANDPIGTTEPVPVVVLPDGMVECRFGLANGRDLTLMKYEFLLDDATMHKGNSK
jgi:hypothetical protein